ncbi:hypothetical protein GW17_00004491, partial [Ensete ventricosum]
KVCNFDLYCPVRTIRTSPLGYRYTDRPLPGGTAKIDRRGRLREKLTINGRLREQKERRRVKEDRRRRGEEERSTSFPSAVLAYAPSLSSRRAIFLPCEETERIPVSMVH